MKPTFTEADARRITDALGEPRTPAVWPFHWGSPDGLTVTLGVWWHNRPNGDCRGYTIDSPDPDGPKIGARYRPTRYVGRGWHAQMADDIKGDLKALRALLADKDTP